jgi:hypothetical protein
MNTENNSELNSGLLIMGMSNTVFFGEGVVHELVLVDLSSGTDFTLPISEEQAQLLFERISNGADAPEEPPEVQNVAEKNAWNSPETTPQL